MRRVNGTEGAAATTTAYSVQVMLPDALDRQLASWTDAVPGASWPAWGGHIAIVARFSVDGTRDMLEQALSAVCQTIAPFDLRLNTPLLVEDVTRPGYFAVFLTPDPEAHDGVAHLHMLYKQVRLTLDSLGTTDLFGLDGKPFLPHVTLALGLGEPDAAKILQTMRGDPVDVELLVDAIWLLEHGERGDPTAKHRIQLEGA